MTFASRTNATGFTFMASRLTRADCTPEPKLQFVELTQLDGTHVFINPRHVYAILTHPSRIHQERPATCIDTLNRHVLVTQSTLEVVTKCEEVLRG